VQGVNRSIDRTVVYLGKADALAALTMIEVLPAQAGPSGHLKLPADAPCQLSSTPVPLTPPTTPSAPPQQRQQPPPPPAAANEIAAGAAPKPTQPLPLPTPPAVVVGASYKLLALGIVRASAELQSEKVAKLEPGEVVVALGTKDVGATTRVRCERGWVSVTSKTGTLLLERTAAAPLEPEPEPEPAAKPAGGTVKFQGRHLDFLRNMAAARKKAKGMAANAAEAQAAQRARLQAKVLGRCKEVATESLGALPPQQQALIAAQAANMTALDSRPGKKGRSGLSQSLPRPGLCAEKGRTKTFSLDGRSSSAGGIGASGGPALLRDLRSSREQVLFQSTGGPACGCDDFEPPAPKLQGSGSRGRTAAAAAQKRVGRASVVFASDVDAAWNVQAHSLQRRLTATNLEEAKAAFLEDPTVDPVFKYEHDIESHQLERFPVCKRWVRA
jgi:hypothetical protein